MADPLEGCSVNRNISPPATSGAPTSKATVTVVLPHERDHGYAAVLELRGEHDVATATSIDQALRGLEGNVLVDLAACELVDSTVIGVFLDDVRVRDREGQRLDLLLPASNAGITRTFEVMGVGELVIIHDSLPPAR